MSCQGGGADVVAAAGKRILAPRMANEGEERERETHDTSQRKSTPTADTCWHVEGSARDGGSASVLTLTLKVRSN